MYYVATERGFFRPLHPNLFTANIRLAQPFATFEAADAAAKVLGHSIRFYAVLVTA